MQYYCTTPELIAANPTDPWEKQKGLNWRYAAEHFAASLDYEKPLIEGYFSRVVYVREEGSREALSFEVRTEVDFHHRASERSTVCHFPPYPQPQHPVNSDARA